MKKASAEIKIIPISMIDYENNRLFEISYFSDKAVHLHLKVMLENGEEFFNTNVAFDSGNGKTYVKMRNGAVSQNTQWTFCDDDGNVCAEAKVYIDAPVERTFYIMVSSHTDIGLHNSQYIQRYNSSRFLDKAMLLCDKTSNLPAQDKYRYTVEGTWFFDNYVMDRGKNAAKKLVDKYISSGDIGVCSFFAGNHIQTFGLEEMCRSTYEKNNLLSNQNVKSETMSMIDNNGMPMSMIEPFCNAGYKNVIFSPNQWNPLDSGVWNMDRKFFGCTWSSEANGGGSRIDVRYTSALPMLFYWEDDKSNRLLVWASLQYDNGGDEFGLDHRTEYSRYTLPTMEARFSEKLPLLDKKYPYRLWLLTCYGDDEEPNERLLTAIREWNKKWKWPCLRTLGNPNEPFDIIEKEYADKIPTVRGDITGGWYQHPVSAPDYLADKFTADRTLPNAEKWSVIASLSDENYLYPKTDFSRAWYYLLCNDEHSYGTSGYQGRRVYETWLQHKDWIEKATETAKKETNRAISSILKNITTEKNSVAVFNPTMQYRTEAVKDGNRFSVCTIPPLGYKIVSKGEWQNLCADTENVSAPPIIENDFYRVTFAPNGAINSIFDKQLNGEIVDRENAFCINDIVYTADNHKKFAVCEKAQFEVTKTACEIAVTVKTVHKELGAEIISKIVLPQHEKRIDVCNHLQHMRDMINKNRYYRYLYFAFPFMVKDGKRLCHLNGCVSEYAKDVSGYGTDVYMAVHEWCCAENKDFGVALMMLDSQLVEFSRIHPDKTDFANAGDGSQMFVYAANDWLQMHTPGGSHLNCTFRFSITSYKDGYIKAKIPQMAERFSNPVLLQKTEKNCGKINGQSHSFLEIDKEKRLITLKAAEDGNGIIARFYDALDCDTVAVKTLAGKLIKSERITVDERQGDRHTYGRFATYRLTGKDININLLSDGKTKTAGKPSPVGENYTGLISVPRAVCTENDGELYLLWGYNTDEDFSHYKLYRSEKSGFVADKDTFVADVLPEKYVVGRYVDSKLKHHTRYYYRVCAVNNNGVCGDLSSEFSAYTREN